MAPGPVGIRAVDNLCLLRVEHQPTRREPLLKSRPQGFGLVACPTVADRVIRVPFKGNRRMSPRHPPIERIVQEQIREDRTNDRSLRGSRLPSLEAAIIRKAPMQQEVLT
jgi:hypothetical protein